MNIVRVTYTDAVQREWLHEFYDNVLVGLFNEELIPDFDTFFGQVQEPSRAKNWYCMLAMAGVKPVGGITAEYMPESNCCIIEFLQTMMDYQTMQEQLLSAMVQSLHAMHRKAKHIFIELVPNAGNMGSGFYRDWCKRIEMKYVTPPIREDADPGFGLELCVVDELIGEIHSSEVVSFINEYFRTSFSGVDIRPYLPKITGVLKVSPI